MHVMQMNKLQFHCPILLGKKTCQAPHWTIWRGHALPFSGKTWPRAKVWKSSLRGGKKAPSIMDTKTHPISWVFYARSLLCSYFFIGFRALSGGSHSGVGSICIWTEVGQNCGILVRCSKQGKGTWKQHHVKQYTLHVDGDCRILMAHFFSEGLASPLVVNRSMTTMKLWQHVG